MPVNAASGVGVYALISHYSASISETFLNPNKLRMIETLITSKQDLDIVPINEGFDNKVTDKYIEFRIPKAAGLLI